jgi:flagellar protein FlaI
MAEKKIIVRLKSKHRPETKEGLKTGQIAETGLHIHLDSKDPLLNLLARRLLRENRKMMEELKKKEAPKKKIMVKLKPEQEKELSVEYPMLQERLEVEPLQVPELELPTHDFEEVDVSPYSERVEMPKKGTVKKVKERKKILVKLRPMPKEEKKPEIRTGLVSTGAVASPIVISEKRTSEEKYEEKSFIERKVTDGVDIPDVKTEFEPEEEKKIKRKFFMKYPLIPQHPKKGDKIFAYAHIFWDRMRNEMLYKVVEPPLTEQQKIMLENVKNFVQEKLDINFAQLKKRGAGPYITEILDKALDYYGVKLKPEEREIYRYYVIRDFVGLEKIEPLLKDLQVEDISCDGIGIPIYVYHRNPHIGSVKTNIVFKTKEELDSFVIRLAERCGKSISIAKPLLDGTLPEGSRVQATLGSDIARYGSNFTIRLFTEHPLTPIDIINFRTMDLKMLAYLWFAVEHGSSILIAGGTATGKTSLLNALSLFIKPELKIISIEDTAELRLPHPHWLPEVAREVISEVGSGKVDMYELLRESLRQRPDYIIVGEVRGREAYVLFQQIATGHPGLSTIHAEDLPRLMDRLTTPPIELPPNLIEALDIIIFLKRVKQKNKYIRKANEVIEIIGYDRKDGKPIVNTLLKWDPKTDDFRIEGKSYVLKKIADSIAGGEDEVKKEIENRIKILKWMKEKNILDYRKIGAIMKVFYSRPEILLEKVGVYD